MRQVTCPSYPIIIIRFQPVVQYPIDDIFVPENASRTDHKYKAVNLKIKYYKSGKEMPYGFDEFTTKGVPNNGAGGVETAHGAVVPLDAWLSACRRLFASTKRRRIGGIVTTIAGTHPKIS